MSSTSSAIELIKQKTKKINLMVKARDIALGFGTKHKKNHGAWWHYEDKVIHIGYDDYGQNLYVEKKDMIKQELNKVLDIHLGDVVGAVLQDDWIAHLQKIYDKIPEQDTVPDPAEAKFKDETGGTS